MPQAMQVNRTGKRLLRSVCLIFVLMFLSNIYQAIDTPLKMIALFLTVVCFLDAAVHERVQLSQHCINEPR